MAHQDKLNEADDAFLSPPQGALVVAQGVNGTESWIERDKTTTVRLVIVTVAAATHGAGTLEAAIETDGGTARAQDGPRSAEDHHQHLQAAVSVQAVVREGERLKFRAFPDPQGARVLRTVVYTTDLGRA